jgi:hypothetical protein
MMFRVWDHKQERYVGRAYKTLSVAESRAHHKSTTLGRVFHAEAVCVRVAHVECRTPKQFRDMRIAAQQNERIAGARCGAMGEFCVLDEERFHNLKCAYEAKELKPCNGDCGGCEACDRTRL